MYEAIFELYSESKSIGIVRYVCEKHVYDGDSFIEIDDEEERSDLIEAITYASSLHCPHTGELLFPEMHSRAFHFVEFYVTGLVQDRSSIVSRVEVIKPMPKEAFPPIDVAKNILYPP